MEYPPLNKAIHVKVESEMLAAIKDNAKRSKITVSIFVREAIRNAIDKSQKTKRGKSA